MSTHLERISRIYNRLRRGPVTIEVLSKWVISAGIQVGPRQLYRDLNQLKTLQFAEGESIIEFTDEKNHKTWKLEYKEGSGKLTPFDINSFFLLKNFAPYAILEERKVSIEKLERYFYRNFSKNEYQKYIQANEMFLRSTNYNENIYSEIEHQQIEDLIWALHNNRIIIIERDLINSANLHLGINAFPLTMVPMELISHRGRIHIAGLSEKKQLLIFALDKAFVFRLTNDTFKRNEYLVPYRTKFSSLFGISDPLEHKIYNIRLEFTKGYAESMKSFYWHHSQVWRELRNGNYTLELKCSIGRELIGFIAIGLDKIKVLQPEVLKEMIILKFKQSAMINEQNLIINEEKANQIY